MGVEYQAANVKAPQGDGTSNTNVLRFTCTNASKSNALPASGWGGRYLYIFNEGTVDADFFFSTNAAATIADSASTDAGTGAATMGGRVRASGERYVRIPFHRPDQTMYFLRYSASSTTLRLEASSD